MAVPPANAVPFLLTLHVLGATAMRAVRAVLESDAFKVVDACLLIGEVSENPD